MKYHVTYRLLHAQYMPTMSVVVVNAHTHTHTHAELDMKLAKIVTKWQLRGYTIQIMKVAQGNDLEEKPRKVK